MMLASSVCKSIIFRPVSLSLAGRALATSSASSAEAKKAPAAVAAPQGTGAVVPEKHSAVAEVDEYNGMLSEPMRPTGEVLIYEGPERDVVNFPRMVQPLYGGRTRLGFIPEEWFDFFYKKTGVTGPYVFGVGLITTLLSKELWVVEHEFPLIPPLILFGYLAMTRLGPSMAKAADKEGDAWEEDLIQVQESNMVGLQQSIKNEEFAQWSAKGQSVLFEAKRENVALQLEAEFRRRQQEVYTEVKKRLDYQVEVQNARRGVERRHMVNWIVNGVVKGIDERQEKQNIDNCIANLQRLSAA